MKDRSRTGDRVTEWFYEHPNVRIDAQALAAALDYSVSRASIYRQLARLVKEDVLREVANPDGAGKCYIYPGPAATLRIQCQSCGHEVTIACPEVTALSQHLAEAHHLHWDSDLIAFSTQCEDCQERKL